MPHPELAFEAREEGVPGLDGVRELAILGVDQHEEPALVEERPTLGERLPDVRLQAPLDPGAAGVVCVPQEVVEHVSCVALLGADLQHL